MKLYNKDLIIKKVINNDYEILKYFNGHIPSLGTSANQERNPYMLIKDKNTNEEFYGMFCEEDAITYFSKESLDLVKNNYTWYHHKDTGYILGSVKINNERKRLYLHQLIMDHYGNTITKGNLSVDHINQNKLDNRLTNLRLATQTEQNQNTDKRARKYNAKPLPDDLLVHLKEKYNTDNVPKFINCNYDKSNDNYIFTICKHPKQQRNANGSCIPIKSSKSKFKNTIDKYEEILIKLDKLNNDIYYEEKLFLSTIKDPDKLPKYVTLAESKRTENKKVLTFDKKVGTKRENLKHTFNFDADLEENMDIFRVKVFNKYGYLLDDKYTIEELKDMDIKMMSSKKTKKSSTKKSESETEESISAI